MCATSLRAESSRMSAPAVVAPPVGESRSPPAAPQHEELEGGPARGSARRLQRLLHLLRHQRCGELVETRASAVAILVVLRDVRPRPLLRQAVLAAVDRPGEDADELFDGEIAIAVGVELGEGVAQLARCRHAPRTAPSPQASRRRAARSRRSAPVAPERACCPSLARGRPPRPGALGGELRLHRLHRRVGPRPQHDHLVGAAGGRRVDEELDHRLPPSVCAGGGLLGGLRVECFFAPSWRSATAWGPRLATCRYVNSVTGSTP